MTFQIDDNQVEAESPSQMIISQRTNIASKIKNKRKEYVALVYLYGASPIEKPILRTALGRQGYKAVSYNEEKAIFVDLAKKQPKHFRTREPR